ncbi:MAG: cobalamin-binding protein [Chloroflexi bacterium]|nr:cobalamin-binding protein [Chloroflexota bacterium]
MSEKASRIVSLAPSNTEILCALGLADRLVGVDADSDYPPEVQWLPKVGRGMEIDTARVAELKPDLVVATLGAPGMERVVSRLEGQGLRCLTLAPRSLGEVIESFLLVGEAVGCQGVARQMVDGMNETIERVATLAAESESRPSVYWEWWPKPLVTAGRLSWMTDMIEMAGGVNAFAELDQESPAIDEDLVFGKRPDVMIASWCGAERQPKVEMLKARRGWEIVPAVQRDRVYTLGEFPFDRPGPRLAEGLELVARVLHPELFP